MDRYENESKRDKAFEKILGSVRYLFIYLKFYFTGWNVYKNYNLKYKSVQKAQKGDKLLQLAYDSIYDYVIYHKLFDLNSQSNLMFIEPTITWVPPGFSGCIWLDTKIDIVCRNKLTGIQWIPVNFMMHSKSSSYLQAGAVVSCPTYRPSITRCWVYIALLTSDSSLAACGAVIGSANSGQCYPYLGEKETCELGGSTYEFFRFNFGGRVSQKLI